MKVQVETIATVTRLKERLSKLDEKMIQVKYDITRFNDYVNQQLAQLSARGASSSDTYVHLMTGYKTVENQEFNTYIEAKNNQFEDNNDLSHYKLMIFSENKFKSLLQSGTWNKLTKEKEEIIALKAHVEESCFLDLIMKTCLTT